MLLLKAATDMDTSGYYDLMSFLSKTIVANSSVMHHYQAPVQTFPLVSKACRSWPNQGSLYIFKIIFLCSSFLGPPRLNSESLSIKNTTSSKTAHCLTQPIIVSIPHAPTSNLPTEPQASLGVHIHGSYNI